MERDVSKTLKQNEHKKTDGRRENVQPREWQMSDAAGKELKTCSVTREGEKSSGKQRRGHHGMPTRGKNR